MQTTSNLSVIGFLKVFDPETNEVFVDKQNTLRIRHITSQKSSCVKRNAHIV